MSTEKILEYAHFRANNRKKTAKAKSMVGTKIRKWAKPKNATDTAVNLVTNFIPIPFVGGAISYGEQKITTELREGLRKGGKDMDDYHLMKFQIKNFDLKQMDLARHKVKTNLDAYNQFGGSRFKPCQTAFNVGYRFYRAEHRLSILTAMAETMKKVAEETLAYCKDQELKMDHDSMVKYADSLVANGNHKECEKGKCVGGAGGAAHLNTGYRDVESQGLVPSARVAAALSSPVASNPSQFEVDQAARRLGDLITLDDP